MKKKTIIVLCCVVAVGTALAVATKLKSTDTVTVSAAPSQVTVSAASPETGDIALTGEFIGTVEPEQQVAVFPKISGTVLNTYFEVGQAVKKGDLLYEVDPEMLRIQYNAAEANAEVQRITAEQRLGSGYESSLINAKSALDRAQLSLDTARNNLKNYNEQFGDNAEDAVIAAKRVSDRAYSAYKAAEKAEKEYLENNPGAAGNLEDEEYIKLRDKTNELEKTYSMAYANYNTLEADDDSTHRNLRTAYTSAQDAYGSAKETYDLLAGTSKDETQATVDASLVATQAGLEAQAKQLEYAKIYSPIDGIVEQKNINAHDLTAPSSPAFVVSNKSVMTVRFNVSETVVAHLETGDKIQVEHSGKILPSTIIEIPTMVDPQSGLFSIKASIDDPAIVLHTGATVKIYADTEKAKDSVLVPLDTVYYDEETPYVYVYKEGKAVKTVVETGVADLERIQIVSGISAADQVITTWHPKLLDGVEVVLKDTTVSSSAVSSAVSDASSAVEENSSDTAEVQSSSDAAPSSSAAAQ